MKKIIFLLLLLIIFQTNYGQLPDSLKKYYSYINSAEIAICDSNYSEAEKLYNLGFTYKKHPFLIDVYNLTLVYATQKMHKKVYENLKKLADFNYPVTKLEDEAVFTIFADFYTSKYGKKLKKYAENPNYSYNLNLRKTYDSLLVVDQYFRKKEGRYKIYGDTIYKIDDKIVEIVNNLVEKHGFPSEEQIGVHFGFDYKPITIFIMHNYPGVRKPNTFDYTEMLLNAINSGAIYNKKGASLIETNAGYSYYGMNSFGKIHHYRIAPAEFYIPKPEEGIYGYFPIKEEDKELVQELNRKREEIGLSTIEERRKVFKLGVNTLFLLSDGGMIGFDVTEAKYKKIVEKIIQIKYQ